MFTVIEVDWGTREVVSVVTGFPNEGAASKYACYRRRVKFQELEKNGPARMLYDYDVIVTKARNVDRSSQQAD